MAATLGPDDTGDGLAPLEVFVLELGLHEHHAESARLLGQLLLSTSDADESVAHAEQILVDAAPIGATSSPPLSWDAGIAIVRTSPAIPSLGWTEPTKLLQRSHVPL